MGVGTNRILPLRVQVAEEGLPAAVEWRNAIGAAASTSTPGFLVRLVEGRPGVRAVAARLVGARRSRRRVARDREQLR